MRFITLLFITLLCTCVRAQNFYDGNHPSQLRSLANTPFFTINLAGDLVVLDPKKENSKVYTYRGKSPGETRPITLKMEAQKIEKITTTPDGGLLVIGKEGKKTLLLEWMTPALDSSFLSEKEIITSEKYTILDAFRKAGGETVLFYAVKDKTYQIPLRLVRDTMKELPRLFQETPEKIYDFPLIAMTRLPNGSFVGVGTDGRQPYLQNFSEEGRPTEAKQPIPSANFTRVETLSYHPATGGILVAGKNENSVQWLLIDGNGKFLINKKFNVLTDDLALQRLIVKNDDSVVMLGTSTTRTGQVDWQSIWLASLSTDLKRGKVQKTSPENWLGKEIQLLSGDRVLVAGYGKDSPKTLHFGLEDPGSVGANAVCVFSPASLIDQQGDGTLDAGEAAALEIPWSTGETSARGIIKATLTFATKVSGLPKRIVGHSYPVLGKDSGVLHLPFYGGKGLPTGTHGVTITFELEGVPIDTQAYQLKTRSAPIPDVVFQKAYCYLEYPVGKDSAGYRRLDTLTVHLRVKNQGRDIARAIDLKALAIPNVIFSGYYFSIPDLAPGEHLDTSMQVIPHSYFKYMDLNMNFFLYDGSGKQSFLQLAHKLPNVFLMEAGGRRRLVPEFENYPNGGRGGPSPYFFPDFVHSVQMIIPRPNSLENNMIESPMNYVPIRFGFSDTSKREDLNQKGQVFILEGPDFNLDEKLSPVGGGVFPNTLINSVGTWNYELQTELRIPEKETQYKVCFTTKEGGVICSTSFTVKPYDRLERTLHICFIAPEYGGNEPTRLSVEKMESLLREKGIIKKGKGRFFSEVYPEMLFQATETSIKAYIDRKVIEIKEKKTKNKRDPLYHDYFLFYVVGHGIVELEDFRLINSNHEGTFSAVETLIEPLAGIPAEKFYIIDACHSAKVNEAIDSLDLSDVPKNKFAVRILAASADSSSYPKDGSAPTIFSSALMRVLDNLLSTPDASQSIDGVISTEELWEALDPVVKKDVKKWREEEDDPYSFPLFLPRYNFSSNLGRPSYIDYFFELSLQKKL